MFIMIYNNIKQQCKKSVHNYTSVCGQVQAYYCECRVHFNQTKFSQSIYSQIQIVILNPHDIFNEQIYIYMKEVFMLW